MQLVVITRLMADLVQDMHIGRPQGLWSRFGISPVQCRLDKPNSWISVDLNEARVVLSDTMDPGGLQG